MSSSSNSNNASSSGEQTPRIHGMHHSGSITGVADFDGHFEQQAAKNVAPPSPFERRHDPDYQQNRLYNVTARSAGARVLFATDEWFAAADNMLNDESSPIFDPDAYCEQGKVMDGWETRRRREVGHDWCIIKLRPGARVRLVGVEIDTAHFTGNHVPAISLDVADLTCTQETAMVMGFPGALERLLHGCVQGTGASPEEVRLAEEACHSHGIVWHQFLPKTPLRPGYEFTRMHYYTVEVPMEATHVRVNYYPDGGVARLKLWGEILAEPRFPKSRPAYSPIKTGRTCSVIAHSTYAEDELPSRQEYEHPDLACQENGGQGIACSNKHYGDPWNLIQATSGRDMGDGWETARHPNRPSILLRDPITQLVDSPLSDWCIVKLGQVAGQGVSRIIVDTKHFRGNYPESVLVEGCYVPEGRDLAVAMDPNSSHISSTEWFPLIPRGRMAPDSEHVYDRDKGQIVNATRKVSHIRFSIFPDGGLSRVHVYGAPGELQ